MFGLKLPELLLILAVVLLIFGGSRLPALGKALGGSFRGFRKAIREKDQDDGRTGDDPDK
jgi:sec-independent protein translocase protein TatA